MGQFNTVYIAKFDSLGDYILFRDAVPLIKRVFNAKKLVLIGNASHQELILHDSFFDDYIFIDPFNFESSDAKEIGKDSASSCLISFMFSPEYFTAIEEIIINVDFTRTIVGYIPNVDHKYSDIQDRVCRAFSDSYQLNSAPVFELNRYTEFLNKLCKRSDLLLSDLMFLDLSHEFIARDEGTISFLLGAGSRQREWGYSNVAEIIEWLESFSSVKRILLLGTPRDESWIESTLLGCSKAVSLVRETSLSELVRLIAKSTFVLTNESAGAHICAHTQTPYLCISNMNHYIRFHPYPNQFKVDQTYIYPADGEKMSVYDFQVQSPIDINNVSQDTVKFNLGRILKLDEY